ncbi:MAG TPA: hypothetical protein VLU92_07670 [Candidatus Dormibacteraeota bacterium]|nr:hypothetical protein [Candidatus Dormibacteraeota bacterium]
MRFLLVLATLPLWFLLTAARTVGPTPGSPSPSTAASPTPSPTPTPPPSPSPIPANAFLTLDVATGPVNTDITVSGGAFLASEQMTLYWDPPSTKVAGGANADPSGNFTTHVKPFAGDAPGIHHLCASVAPFPCANFTLVAATPSPSPSPSPSPDASPSPSPSPSDTPTALSSPTPGAATLSGIDLITRPPFVFIPIIGVLAILASLAYWLFSVFRRPPAPAALPAAAVVHRATRPDYAAEFGTPPPAPAPVPPPPSAWDDMATAPPVAPTPPPAAPVEPEPPVSDLPSAPDGPPDLPEPAED